MRGIVWGLLFVNLVFAAWILYDLSREPVVAPVPASLELPATLQLISEVDSSQLVSRGVAPDVASTPAEAGVCVELGPYLSAQAAQDFADTLSGYDFTPLEYSEIEVVNYRAYIAPLDSRSEAEEVLGRLRSTIERLQLRTDGFLIGSGELENGISLGLFGDRSNALALERALDAQGFAVSVREEPRMRQEFWLVSSRFEAFADFQAWWSQIDQPQSDIEAREKLCETIALPF